MNAKRPMIADSRNPTPFEPEPNNPGLSILIRAQKDSKKRRWTDHFLLQLRAHGYRVIPFSAYQGRTFDASSDARKLVVEEFRFHPERLWRFDFAVPALKIAVEIDGGIWMGGQGAHSRPMNIQRDIEKSNNAALLGWRLLRFSDKEVRSGDSIAMLQQLSGQ